MAAARRTAARSASPPPAAAARGARRRAETRARLIEAARVLMARQGVHATTIQEITDAADLGFGSFFNHFPSKDAIADAVMQDAIDTLASAGARLAGKLADPAELVAAGIRHTVRRAEADEAFGRFLARTALAGTAPLRRGLGRRLAQDIRAGIAARRFRSGDPPVAIIAAGGAVLACIVGRLNGELGADAAERTAAMVLQLLGLPVKEAVRLARRPLPPLDDDATPPARRSNRTTPA